MSTSNVNAKSDREPAWKSAARKFIAYIKQIKVAVLLIAATAAAISKYVIRDRLVPEQVDWLADTGVLVAMAALVVLPLYSGAHLRTILKVALFLSLTVIVGVRASLIQDRIISGRRHLYLVGFSLTPAGKTMEQNCMQAEGANNLTSLSTSRFLRCIEPDDISKAYGRSYLVVCLAYSAAYMLFLGIFVILVGHQMQSNSASEIRAPN